MPPERRDEAWLWDMLVAARIVVDITAKHSHEQFMSDPLVRGAVERYIEILGEAAGRVRTTFRSDHPEVA